MTPKQAPSADEDYEMGMKAPQQANKWTLN